MASSPYLIVNGVDFPCPHVGFQYVISQAVDSGRNVKGGIVSQLVGREQFKLDQLEWIGLYPEDVQRITGALKDFFVPVTFEDCRTGSPITITMYHGDITLKPLFADPETGKVTQYEKVKVNLIDCGWDE